MYFEFNQNDKLNYDIYLYDKEIDRADAIQNLNIFLAISYPFMSSDFEHKRYAG